MISQTFTLSYDISNLHFIQVKSIRTTNVAAAGTVEMRVDYLVEFVDQDLVTVEDNSFWEVVAVS